MALAILTYWQARRTFASAIMRLVVVHVACRADESVKLCSPEEIELTLSAGGMGHAIAVRFCATRTLRFAQLAGLIEQILLTNPTYALLHVNKFVRSFSAKT